MVYTALSNNTFSYGYNYNIAYTVTGNRLVTYKRDPLFEGLLCYSLWKNCMVLINYMSKNII